MHKRADLNAAHAGIRDTVDELELFLDGEHPLLVLQSVAKRFVFDQNFRD